MVNLFHLFLLSFLASILALVGAVIFLFNKKLSKVLEINSVPFAAGVMITVSILGLLPEAIELLGEGAFLVVLASFFTAYLFENFLFELHHHSDDHHDHNPKSSVALVVVGDTIHNFIDGIAIGAAYLLNPGLGLVTAISTFLHEVPHEIGDFGILLKAGWTKKNILILNVISASTAILGAFALLLFSENSILIGTLLSVSTGIFLYLGAIDFLPHATKGFSSRLKAVVPLVIGIVAMVITLMAIPHSHEHEEGVGNVDHGHSER